MLQKQTFNIPLGYGVDQSTDKRSLNLPALAVLKDAEMEEQGGLQTRKPCTALGVSIFGGSSFSASDVRHVVPYGNELLLFTKDKLYSWNATSESWVDKGTHLAVKSEEASRFVRTGDQIGGDRVELGGYVLVSWHEVRGGNTYGYLAAFNKETGAVTLPPYELAGFQRIRLVALDTKVLLSFYDGITGHYCYALDPADPATALGGSSTTVFTGGNVYYDVDRIHGSDAAMFAIRRNPTSSYELVKMTGALARTASTKARVSNGPIGISVTPDGLQAQIVRVTVADGDGVDLLGDLITVSSLADVYTDQDLYADTTGAIADQITVAHRSTQVSGAWRAHVFMTFGEYATPDPLAPADFELLTNWVDTSNNVGTPSLLLRNVGIASRAFTYDGDVYLWTGFAEEGRFDGGDAVGFNGALQNTYFLYRSDGFLVAKAAAARGGGHSPFTGWLGGVQDLGDGEFAWCAGERRIITLGGKRSAFGKRAPREVVFAFDSDEARRCVKLGQTLYITGALVLQYDGNGMTEVGFGIYPWYFLGTPDSGGANLNAGDYAYKITWRWENAKGELDRSTTATVGLVTIPGAGYEADFNYIPLNVTRKQGDFAPVAVEFWRTAINPTQDAPFSLVTNKDPTATGDNAYLANDPLEYMPAFTDDIADDDLPDQEENPENGGVLLSLAPPPATIIAASDDRIFLAGVAGDPDYVWYSKQRADGQVAAFHGNLRFPVPSSGGAITGLVVRDGLVYVFRETALYVFPGDGFDNTGGGQNYGPARVVSYDVGAASQEAIAVEPAGIVFHSRKGKYRVSGVQLSYIGGAVKDYDDEEVLAVHVVESQHQIRWVTSSRVLVLDYSAGTPQNPVGQWMEWTLASGVHACVWDGSWVFLSSSNGALVQQTAYGDDVTYGIDLETPWIKMNDLQGAGRVWRILVLGEHLGGVYKLRVRIARNYEVDEDTGDPAWFDDKPWPRVGESVDDMFDVGSAFEAKIGPSIQRCESIKIRVTVVAITSGGEGGSYDDIVYAAPTVPAVKLTGIGLEVGVKPNMTRRFPVESKA